MDVFAEVASARRGYLRDAVLHAARALSLEGALPASAEDACARLGLRGARRLRRLLEALVFFGLAERRGDVFHARFDGQAARPVSPGGWGSLAQVIREDAPLREDPDALARFHRHLAAAGAEAARELWRSIETAGPLLDLGGGTGAYTRAFLERHPGERATLVDRAEVLALAGEVPGARLVELDILRKRLPPEAGVALLANVLHLFGPDDCRRIVSNARAALRPGGLLVVKDLRIEPGREGPAEGVLFALNMAVFTREGDVHDSGRLQSFVEGAGLREPRLLRLECSEASVVLTARAP